MMSIKLLIFLTCFLTINEVVQGRSYNHGYPRGTFDGNKPIPPAVPYDPYIPRETPYLGYPPHDSPPNVLHGFPPSKHCDDDHSPEIPSWPGTSRRPFYYPTISFPPRPTPIYPRPNYPPPPSFPSRPRPVYPRPSYPPPPSFPSQSPTLNPRPDYPPSPSFPSKLPPLNPRPDLPPSPSFPFPTPPPPRGDPSSSFPSHLPPRPPPPSSFPSPTQPPSAGLPVVPTDAGDVTPAEPSQEPNPVPTLPTIPDETNRLLPEQPTDNDGRPTTTDSIDPNYNTDPIVDKSPDTGTNDGVFTGGDFNSRGLSESEIQDIINPRVIIGESKTKLTTTS